MYYLQIEHAAYEFTINYFADTINLTVYNPNGEMVDTGPSLFTSANTYSAIVRVSCVDLFNINANLKLG